VQPPHLRLEEAVGDRVPLQGAEQQQPHQRGVLLGAEQRLQADGPEHPGIVFADRGLGGPCQRFVDGGLGLEDGRVEVVLGGEVLEDRRLAAAGGLGDLLGGAPEALARKEGERCVDDHAPSLLAP
jgi:hypothetical protein